MTSAKQRLYCAIDTADLDQAREWIALLAPEIGGVKLGLEFFAAHGPDGVRAVMAGCDLPVFLDLKLHDIPNTVAGAVRAVLPLQPSLVTIHASGGTDMLAAAQAAVAGTATRLLAITVLTSLARDGLAAVGQGDDTAAQAARLASLAAGVGIAGCVCSAQEVAALRAVTTSAFLLLTPGIRPAAAAVQDQQRPATPAAAIAAGADLLVVGRPITQAADPVAASRAIVAEIAAAPTVSA